MANITIPNLRHENLLTTGYLTIPADETWVVKAANAYCVFDEILNNPSSKTSYMSVITNIDGNASIVWSAGQDLQVVNATIGGYVVGDYIKNGPIFAGSMIMKGGDSFRIDATNTAEQRIYLSYYILEEDF